MLEFNAIIHKFGKQGEKTGWTYIEIPAEITQELMPENKKSFRVKGMLDGYSFTGIALIPIGEGAFIMALNKELRKGIRKGKGSSLRVSISIDADYKVEVPVELQEYFDQEPIAGEFFHSLAKSHREYFIKWIDQAKTQPTRSSRIVNTLNAMSNRMDYGQMIRSLKKLREL